MKYLFIIQIVFLVFVSSAYGQDIHLSQFYTSDDLLNPAKTGDYIGDFKITANYRTQWRQVANGNDGIGSFMLAYNKPVFISDEEVDIGVIFTQDNFEGLSITGNKILISTAYQLELGQSNVRVGVQFGPVFRSTDFSNYFFPNQWVYYPDGTFDNTLPNNENGVNNASTYLDLNFGSAWKREFNKLTLDAGFALNHINRPNDSHFNTSSERLRVRKVVHVMADYRLSSKIIIEPKMQLMWTTKANVVLFGGNAKIKSGFDLISWMTAGLFYRHGFGRTIDAIYPVVGLRYSNFDVGFSYDYNVSDLSGVDSRKASFEVSIVYTAPISKTDYALLPCFRY
ncbi:MAG: PorP/SprF family type IX secretion system membrane protein [Flavobacteriales bacterium]|nr:PorP/SprF family type IX secretion system membrane protein [Flavobacteriales bacterium]